MESLPTEQPDPFEAFIEATQQAAAAGVTEEAIGVIAGDFDLGLEEQTRRILELAEFRRGDQSATEWERLPVDDAKIALTVYETDINPSVAMSEGGFETTESEREGYRLSALRHSIRGRLDEIDVDPDIIHGAITVASEFGGNVIRRNTVAGGRIACGFDPLGRLVVTAEGRPNPEGTGDISLGIFHDADPSESGRGIAVCKGFGEVSKYPSAHDTDGNPTAWGMNCTLETPQSQALAKLVFEGVQSPYDLGIEPPTPTATTVTPVSLQRPIL